jgi:glycosyltransferase involved in cell wall biosynthesis
MSNQVAPLCGRDMPITDISSHQSFGAKRRNNRRALLIAFYYPPSLESGALRPRGLEKYLPEFGWDVEVLTPRVSGVRPGSVIETEYVDLVAEWKRRFRFNPERGLQDQLKLSSVPASTSSSLWTELLLQLRWMLTYPCPFKGWERFGVAAVQQLPRQRYDAMISTAPPLVAHLIAAQAKKILQCPWIADFRDLWNVDGSTLEDRNGIIGRMQGRTERKVLADADALITVSDPWAQRLRRRYPSKPSYCVTNGFDPDEVLQGDCELDKKFSITHTGILYEGRRDPSLLLEVLRELIDAGQINRSDLLLRFYGPSESFVPAILRRFGLEDVAELRSVGRAEVLDVQRRSQLLLVLSWSGPKENGGHTGKIFEYLAARRPVMAYGGSRGVLAELLEDVNAGVHVESKEEIRSVLLKAYGEYKQNGRVSYHGNTSAMNRYSHREMARQFAGVLDTVAPHRAVSRQEYVAG